MSFSPVFVMLVVSYLRPIEVTQGTVLTAGRSENKKRRKLMDYPLSRVFHYARTARTWPCFECAALI
jgi:hypothetical protein